MKIIYKVTITIFSLSLLVACGGGGKEKQSLLNRPFNEVINMSSADLEKAMEGLSLDEKKNLIAAFKSSLKPTELKINIIEKAVKAEDPSYTGQKKKKAKYVTTTPVVVKDHSVYSEVTGVVQSDDHVKITAETSGQIARLSLKENGYVKKGDHIISIDAETVNKNIAELETQLQLARTIYQKRKNLWDQNIGSEIEFIQSKTNVESLEKSIETAKVSLKKFTQYAPASGLVERLYVHQGEILMPGSPIADIINLSRLKVEAELTEEYLTKIKKGDFVTIEVPTVNYSHKAKITEIGTRINAGSGGFKIEMDVPNTGNKLKPNALAYVKVRDSFIEDAIVIPTKLIQDDFDGSYVYIAESVEGELLAKRVNVKLGEVYEDEAIVVSGLTGAEILIDKGYKDVVEKQPLTIAAN